MRTDTLSVPFWSPEEIEAALRPALEQIEMRRVLAYPTETVYGFGGGIDRDSVDALVALKHRLPCAVPPAASLRNCESDDLSGHFLNPCNCEERFKIVFAIG
jgi:hypothetical protein